MTSHTEGMPRRRRRIRSGRVAARRSAWVAFAALVAFAVLLHPAVGSGPLGWVRDVVVYHLACAAAAVAAGYRALGAATPVTRRMWLYLTAALTCMLAADLYTTLVLADLEHPPSVSPADIGYLAFYPLTYAFVIALLRSRMTHWQPSFVIDGLAATLLAAAAALSFVVSPVVEASYDDLASLVVTLAWPVGDVLLIIVLLCGSLIVITGLDRQVLLIVAGLHALAIGDAVYAVVASREGYMEGGVLDLTWVAAFALIAAGTACPPRPVPEFADTLDVVPWIFILLPMSLGAIGVALLSPLAAGRLTVVSTWLVVATLLLAMLRVSLTYRGLWSLKEVRRQALTDELTGLGNRRALAAEGANLLAPRHRVGPDDAPVSEPTVAALLMLDLDGFKEVNDSMGHAAGDALLVELSERLKGAMRSPADVLARLGGDEFAVLLPGADAAEAQALAHVLRAEVSRPVVIDDARVEVSGSLGLALAPEHGTGLSELMRRADIAMYRAKSARAGVAVFDPDLRDMFGEERLQRISQIRHGLERGEFVVYYQPKIDMRTNETLGVEALVRWDHPDEGLLAPITFLPLVEDCGLMPQLTAYVLSVAIGQAADWRARGHTLSVAVNLSPSAVVDTSLPDKIATALRAADLPPELLVLEITEESLLEDRQRARMVLAEIRESGVRISIDDFGSGYSSLSYLRELPVDELKLDRSFVQPMTEDTRAASIVRATIDLAHSLSMSIVAEGVEDDAAASQLAVYGCDVAQGYHYARPQPAADLEAWFDRFAPAPCALESARTPAH